MSRKSVVIAVAVLAIICVFSGLVFGGVITLKKEPVTDPEQNGYDVNDYESGMAAKGEGEALPYLPTSVDGVFYTADTKGNISFFAFDEASNTFSRMDKSGTYSVTVSMSEQNVGANVDYVEKDGKITGFGLYTTAISGDTDSLYRYAFFTVRNMPEAMGSTSDLLLLIDTDEEDFRSEDKIYEEVYKLYKSDLSYDFMFSQANRYVGIDSTKRSDYAMLTDFLVEDAESPVLFLSGRHYAESDDSVDLMAKGGSGNNVDNVLKAKKLIGMYAKNVSDGALYLTAKDGKVVLKNTSYEDPVKTFDAGKDDVLISENCFFFTNSNTMYDVEADAEFKPENENLKGFKADMFRTDGSTVFLRGYIDDVNPAIVIADRTAGTCKVFINVIFTNIINPVILPNGNVLFTVVSNADGAESFTYYVMTK